jgi:hypothetical protein
MTPEQLAIKNVGKQVSPFIAALKIPQPENRLP